MYCHLCHCHFPCSCVGQASAREEDVAAALEEEEGEGKKQPVKKARRVKRKRIVVPKKSVIHIDSKNGPMIDTALNHIKRESEEAINQLKQKRQRIKLNRNSGREYINRLGKRMKQDQDDVQKLIDLFKTYNPFDRTSPELASLTTGDVASEAVTNDLLSAEITGKQVVSEFVENRFIKKTASFHDRIKSKNLQTFESTYTVQVKVGKEKTVALKADRNFLRHVVTAMQAGRDVAMNKMLEQEICTVPLSLAMPDGRLRLPQNKADLGKVLQQGLPQNVAPGPYPTCTIIDGMAMIQRLGSRMNAKTLGKWADAVADRPQLSLFLWMNAGTPKKQHLVPVHSITITDSQRTSLLAFHAVTGSDSTSQFAGIGKRSAWAIFLNNSQLLQNLGREDFLDENVLADAESFVCKLYGPSSQNNSIQQVRCDLFLGLTKAVENLPPTRDALTLHIRRAHYQTLVWRRALEAEPHLPAPEDSGWELVVKEGSEVVGARTIGAPCHCPLKCWERMGSKVLEIFNNFWDLCDFNLQNSYLFTCLKLCDVKRRYTKKPAEDSRRQNTFEYFVRINGKHLRVCKRAFMSCHGLTSDKRLRTLFHQMKDGALVPEPDRRGKHLRPVKSPNGHITSGHQSHHPHHAHHHHHNTYANTNTTAKTKKARKKKQSSKTDAATNMNGKTMYTPPPPPMTHILPHCTPPPPPPAHAAPMQEPPHAYIPNGDIYFPGHYLEPHQAMGPPPMNQIPSCQKMLEAPAYFMAGMKENTFHQ
ncbi:hypothetical protein GWK47_042571 [Chionoecetes opilio]|uniref:Uncharacterized protein n=1 Tax=Chionoecetes opilio TaxID=41210 RepID=A0A8J4YHQ7_CHIOP|nr:hypothetical protein GWK47_042571 [Chionoecetes opilio]